MPDPHSGLQYFPTTLPPSTFVGRIAAGAGPAEAIPFSILASLLPQFASSFATTAALLTAYPLPVIVPDNAIVNTGGYAATGDGGAAMFRYDQSDITSADNGGTIRIDTVGRRWKIIQFGPVFAAWFGATPNKGTAITQALVNAILASNANSPVSYVFMVAGSYLVDDDIAERVLSQGGSSMVIRIIGANPAYLSSNGKSAGDGFLNSDLDMVIDFFSTDYNAPLQPWIAQNYTVIESTADGIFGSRDTATTASSTAGAGATVLHVASASRIMRGKRLTLHLDNSSKFFTDVLSVSGTTITCAEAIPAGRSLPSGNAVGIGNCTRILQEVSNIVAHAKTSAANFFIFCEPMHGRFNDNTAVGFGWGGIWFRQGGETLINGFANYNLGWNKAPSGVRTGASPTYFAGCGVNFIPSVFAGVYAGYDSDGDARGEEVGITNYYSRPYNDFLLNKHGTFDIQGSTLDPLNISRTTRSGSCYFYNCQVYIAQEHNEQSSSSGLHAGDTMPRTWFSSNADVFLAPGYYTNVPDATNLYPPYDFYVSAPGVWSLLDANNGPTALRLKGYARLGDVTQTITVATPGGSDTYTMVNVFPDHSGYQGMISVSLVDTGNLVTGDSHLYWASQFKQYSGTRHGFISSSLANFATGQSGSATALITGVAVSNNDLQVTITWGSATSGTFLLTVSPQGGERPSAQ